MGYNPNDLNYAREASYNLPFSNSSLFLPLLISLMQQQRTPKTRGTFKDKYDYVIVGGGTAGSVLANRLSEEKDTSVLLLEYGGHPPLLSDITSTAVLGKDISYGYKTAPQKHTGFALNENRVPYPSGKVLGGSSVINGLLYVRGNQHNFDNWATLGAEGWSYEEVLPYFIKSENNNNPDYVESGFHGKGGFLSVSDPAYIGDFRAPILEAAKQFGYRIGDSNGAIQTGFSLVQGFTRNGQRCSAAKAFLVPAENRTNLDILINAHVNKVVIEGEPLTATGVEFDHGNQTHVVWAARDVIISAGAINTPQLLMLSGVGPRDELEKHNIELVKDLPVGKNLNDHPASALNIVMDDSIPTWRESFADENIQQYIYNRTGPFASTLMVATSAFLKDNEIIPDEDFPDFKLHFTLADVKSYKSTIGLSPKIYDSYFKQYEKKPILQCRVSLLQPKSVGSVTLNSKNTYDDPIIDTNYLAHPDDIEIMIQGLKSCQKILHSDPVKLTLVAKPFCRFPLCNQHDNDEYLRCYLKHIIFTSYHPTSTAKMGDPGKDDTVVCARLKVKSINKLRVVDASIMPKVTSGNTAAVVYMLAEKAADIIKEDSHSRIR